MWFMLMCWRMFLACYVLSCIFSFTSKYYCVKSTESRDPYLHPPNVMFWFKGNAIQNWCDEILWHCTWFLLFIPPVLLYWISRYQINGHVFYMLKYHEVYHWGLYVVSMDRKHSTKRTESEFPGIAHHQASSIDCL